MDQSARNDKDFLRNDRKLVCGMFLFYGLCIFGLIGALIWGLARRSMDISANATSTAFTVATRQANATAIAIANATSTELALAAQQAKATTTAAQHATKQAKYSFVESFNDNRNGWRVEAVDDKQMRGSIAIHEGAYVWDVQEVKQFFYSQATFPLEDEIKDFDTYVDFKIAKGTPDHVCGGFLFRTASIDWEKGTYIFSVCNNTYFYIGYYAHRKSIDISNWMHSDAIQASDWNRLEINARGDHFTFTINNEVVFEMTDDRQPEGSLSLFVEVFEKEPTTIWFDNFGYQGH